MLRLPHFLPFLPPQGSGDGFVDYGVAAPISNHRGIVATVDGDGKDVLLAWLMDYRGGYELLMVDAESGKTQEFPLPFFEKITDSRFSLRLRPIGQKYFYTHFNSHFVEFDPSRGLHFL